MNEDLRLFFKAKKHAALIDEAAVRKSICGKVLQTSNFRGAQFLRKRLVFQIWFVTSSKKLNTQFLVFK